MDKGLWVWPADARAQRKMLAKVAHAPHLVPAMTAVLKSKDGLSNSELDDLIGDNSNWMTLWVVRQLTSLGFIEFKVDYFGNPARYRLTALGMNALSMITGQPVRRPTPAPVQPPAVPKAA